MIVSSPGIQQAVLHILGMSCKACEEHVNNALLQKKGIKHVSTSYEKRISTVKFDSMKISLQQLANVIENETGYKVINK